MAKYSVFTKPWQKLSINALIDVVKGMGYDAIEFPLRDGAQVCPAEAEAKLPNLVAELAHAGVLIDNVTSVPEERVFAACAESQIPMIRVMFQPGPGEYIAAEEKYLRLIDTWIPLCEQYSVKVGVQMHYGLGASNTAEMMRVVSRYDAKHIGAIWDAGHSGLAGEECEQAIDLCWSHLCLVNFKAARYEMRGRDMDGAAVFEPFFCPGADGACSWPRAVAHLKRRGYAGTYCMPAEYTGLTQEQEIAYVRRDLNWLKTLVGE
jgi:sugar phosphate isomerase/epimerase